MGVFGAGTIGRCTQHVRRSGAAGRLWLADGAEGLCRRAAGHGCCCSGVFGAATLASACPVSVDATSSRSCAIRGSGNIASTTRSCSAASSRCRSGCCSISSTSMASTIAQAALLAACFSLPGGVLARLRRLVVGPLRRPQRHLVGAVGRLDLPVPAVLSRRPISIVHTVNGPLSFHIGLHVSGLHRAAVRRSASPLPAAWPSTFKYIGDDFPTTWERYPASSAWRAAWAASCCRSCSARCWTWLGIHSSCFMLLYGIIWVSLISIISPKSGGRRSWAKDLDHQRQSRRVRA